MLPFSVYDFFVKFMQFIVCPAKKSGSHFDASQHNCFSHGRKRETLRRRKTNIGNVPLDTLLIVEENLAS